MKRLINGTEYDTGTATLLAKGYGEMQYRGELRSVEGELYRTRDGAFFVVDAYYMGEDDWNWRMFELSDSDAREWINKGEVELLINPFEEAK